MALDKLVDSPARDYECGAMAEAIRMCLRETGQFTYAQIQQMGIPWLQNLGFAQAIMQGIYPFTGSVQGGGNANIDISGVFDKARAGSFTLASDIYAPSAAPTPYTITHNLGVKPNFFFLYAPGVSTVSGAAIDLIMCVYLGISDEPYVTYLRSRNGQTPTGGAVTYGGLDAGNATASTIVFNATSGSNGVRMAAGTYYWIAGKYRTGGAS